MTVLFSPVLFAILQAGQRALPCFMCTCKMAQGAPESEEQRVSAPHAAARLGRCEEEGT